MIFPMKFPEIIMKFPMNPPGIIMKFLMKAPRDNNDIPNESAQR